VQASAQKEDMMVQRGREDSYSKRMRWRGKAYLERRWSCWRLPQPYTVLHLYRFAVVAVVAVVAAAVECVCAAAAACE
jgi:hypothetical protein